MMKLIYCDKTSCQSNTSHICCGVPCSSSLKTLDDVVKLAHKYVEEKDIEYIHAIWAAAEELGCIGLLKRR